jgi:segregation and condensation protein B
VSASETQSGSETTSEPEKRVGRMDASEKRRIVEALVLSCSEPISAAKLAEIIPYCDAGEVKDLVNELNTEYAEQDRSFEIWEVAGGFQIRTRAEFSGYLQKLQKERALRLSQAALETLAIIAYRQPVTRAEIEDVRGVDVGATVKSLLERHLIRIAGQREVPGRPMLYGTTRRFLEIFGLESLKNLPTLRELDELAREQGLVERTAEATDLGADTGEETEAERAVGDGEVVLRHEDLPAAGSIFGDDDQADSAPDSSRDLADDFEDVFEDDGEGDLDEHLDADERED